MTPTASTPRRFSATRDHRRRPLVGLTPLIDVVFILLLFFMLASNFLNLRSIGLETPGPTGEATSMQGALLIEIREDGIRYGGTSIALDRLTTRVAAQLGRTPDRRVLVRPREGVSLQRAVAVLDRLSAAGARNLSLIGDARAGGRG